MPRCGRRCPFGTMAYTASVTQRDGHRRLISPFVSAKATLLGRVIVFWVGRTGREDRFLGIYQTLAAAQGVAEAYLT
jgi:hypothetical protein